MMPSIRPDRTAIVLVEVQKQWTASGLYHWLIRGQLEAKNVLENTRRLVRTARRAGVTIIHAPLVLDPADRRGWLAHLTFGQIFTKGTARAEFAEGRRDTFSNVQGGHGFVGGIYSDTLRVPIRPRE